MYPQPELSLGSGRKAAVRRAIALRRAQCVEAAAQALQPLELLDRGLALWRRFAPFAGIAVFALGVRRSRAVAARSGYFRTLLRWAPMVLGAVRLFRRSRNGEGGSVETSDRARRHS